MNQIKKNPLGRGLGSLIPGASTVISDAAEVAGKYMEMDITDIYPNDSQPRRDFDAEKLASLADSIRSKGMLQPLVVTKPVGDSETKYMLIAGERRWRAAGLAGLKTVPAVLIEYPADSDRLELALIENTQRDDLTPLEQAQAYKSLMEKCDYSQEDVAHIVGKSRSAVANTLRLLELSANVMEALETKKITEGHARVFLSLNEAQRIRLLNAVINQSLSVRQTEVLAKKFQSSVQMDSLPSPDPNFESLAKEMENFFSARVKMKIRGKNSNRGVIEISYESHEDLDRIVSKLRNDG
ncbi:MAG: ParB/RepB/Spo0J family partition protein [Deferribacteraceae bacterium]|jgi:ParB family chromosome partitioning protein|nr:ParB/RepB/Spo0J family partition protein [Deferribacteraceae bacterium]